MGTKMAEKNIKDFSTDVIGAIRYIEKNQEVLSSRWEKTRREFLEYNEEYEEELSEMIPNHLPSRPRFDKETEALKEAYDLLPVRLFIVKMSLDIRTNETLKDTITLGDVNDFLVAAGVPSLYPRAIEDIIYTYLIENAKPLSKFTDYYNEYVNYIENSYQSKIYTPMTQGEFLHLIETNQRDLIAYKSKDYSKLKTKWLNKYREFNYDYEKMLDYLKEDSDYTSIPNLTLIYLTVNNKMDYLTDYDGNRFDALVDDAFIIRNSLKRKTGFADNVLAGASSDQKFKLALQKLSDVMLKSQQEKMINLIKDYCGVSTEKSLIEGNVYYKGANNSEAVAKKIYGKYSEHYRQILTRENIIEVCTLGLNFDFNEVNAVLESGGFGPLDIKLSPSEAFYYFLLKTYIPYYSNKYESYAEILHHMMTEISKDKNLLQTFYHFFSKKSAELFSYYI